MRILFLIVPMIMFLSSASGQVEADIRLEALRDRDANVIHVNWDVNEENRWREENRDRLMIMALRTDITSTTLPVSESNSTSFEIKLQKNGIIEVLLETDFMAPGEMLLIRDKFSGEIIFSSVDLRKKKVLLPPVDPLKSIFEWRTEKAGSFESDFTIRSIYFDDTVFDRQTEAIGFGTAFPCHPNAACKQDSLFKLMSNSAVRIRMLMEEGIGWCSGSFINNERNDKTPYVLLAYHCTFEYTPQYDLWRFDLGYASDSCVNPATEPVGFSMTGCERKAGGQSSDFLLVLLNEHVPVNHNVTFAGWDRDDVATPDTTYLVHHPNADIRKFSTSVNKSVIHPNQIGWSEGYTTPGNHHLRFMFTEGGHQPGSSGGPVFNQDCKIVAQLHGGNMGCENDNTAFVGRLSRSWNSGTTAADRLKDWLDPDNTGITQLSAIENISLSDLTDIYGVVTDPFGRPVNNVSIKVTGSITETLLTNAAGEFSIQGINRNGQYHIVPEKNSNPINGVSAIDLLAIQKHVLGRDTFDLSWKHIAGDATNNQSISAGDIVLLIKLLLGKLTVFPSSTSWRFDPPFIDVDTIPAGEPLEVQLLGIKIGDLNGSSDPSQ